MGISMALFTPKKKKCPAEWTKIMDQWNFVGQEKDREIIQQWRQQRMRARASRSTYDEFLIFAFNIDTLKSFLQNINFMVIIQMVAAVLAVYIFKFYRISFDMHVSLFVSPIVFPLAFSINTDFQRREKVLEDLAVFKSSALVWYFCMREWKQAAELNNDWMSAVHTKLKSLLFYLREYLLTGNIERRKIILRAIYEDFSDANQLIEKVRASKLPANTAIISRSIHVLNMMCLSFERLRVIREYRSPRSIRSFNKVFIMFLPILLGPYFVYLGIKSNNEWEPYYIGVLVAFVFSVLQGVQDKLDDPFDGMSEDDINLDTIDEWTISSIEHTLVRAFDIGRFKVTVDPQKDPIEKPPRSPKVSRISKQELSTNSNTPTPQPKTPKTSTLKLPIFRKEKRDSVTSVREEPIDYQKLAPLLEGMKGNRTIRGKRPSIHDIRSSLYDNISDESPPASPEPIETRLNEPTKDKPKKTVSFCVTPALTALTALPSSPTIPVRHDSDRLIVNDNDSSEHKESELESLFQRLPTVEVTNLPDNEVEGVV